MSAWPDVQEKIELEFLQLQRLVDEHKSLLQKVTDNPPEPIELSALSAYLHSFYNGMENVFKQIAVGVDGQHLSGEAWHADLLKLMSAPTASRPAVLSSDLLVKLLAYMGFRHVFRHAYTFDLRWEKMRDLVLQSTDVLEEIRDSVKRILG